MIEKLADIDLGDSDIEVIVDGRNCMSSHKIKALGIQYRGIGRRI